MKPSPQKQNPPARVGFAEVHSLGSKMRPNFTPDYAAALREAMRAAGIVTDAEIIGDGLLHRVRVEGDKQGVRDGWYVLHPAPIAAGAFGHWRTGYSQSWRGDSGRTLTPRERKQIDDAIALAKVQRIAEQTERHRSAQARASARWAASERALDDHPYLVRKGVKAHGIRQHGELLLIPLRDTAGTLWSLQTIAPDGVKRFPPGGRKRGLYFSIGAASEVLLIAEGYATGATLHESTGHPVAIAFDAGNLEPVARALRAKFPAVRIVICADDDAATAERIGRNPGIEAATKAARAVGGFIARPDFGSRA